MNKEIKLPRMKEDIENSYAEILAPFATLKTRENSRKNVEPSNEPDNRGSFQRDRDRIIHTKAFRRLMYKTQVFVNHEGDHFRTRLTHTLEVSQFARGICKSLALNEDLAEAISLGHDLGHTPFGHAVERYFDEELSRREMGRFFHNEQSVRVVDQIEQREENIIGLNLTYEVREGILKHNNDRSGIYEELNPNLPCSTLEGQIVSMVDTIAYICHDLEDGIKSGIVERSIKNNPDIQKNFRNLIDLVSESTGIVINTDQYKETYFIRNLIHILIQRLTQDSYENILKEKIISLEDVRRSSEKKKKIIAFSKSNEDFFKTFKKFIYKNIYETQTIATMDSKAVTLASNLFNAYANNPKLLPPKWLYRYNNIKRDGRHSGAEDNELRVICDYISSMTDRYAIEENDRLFNPGIKI